MIVDEIVSFALGHGDGPSTAVPEPTPDEAVWLSALRSAWTANITVI